MKKKDLESKIDTLERAIKSPATSAEHRTAMKEQLKKLRAELYGPYPKSEEAKTKMQKVFDEWDAGTLKDSHGNLVTDHKQAIAIALSEARTEEKEKRERKKSTKPAAKKTPAKKKEKKAKRKLTPDECQEIIKETEARRKKYKASGRKYRTKPVSEKIAGNITTATKQAIENIPADKFKEDPKGMIVKVEKLEKSANEFFADFRAILGEDYDQSEAAKELDKISGMISDLKKKYSEK